jgi:CBS domain-containing membrane protein
MELLVKDIMTSEVVSVSPGETIRNAKNLFDRKGIRHAPVVKDNKLVGIVSLTDLQRMSFADTYGMDETGVDMAMADMLTVNQVMKSKPVTVRPDDLVKQVAELLTKAEFHALPVVVDNQLKGIITTTDIIRVLLEYL